MSSAHFLGNFRSPAPLRVMGSPRQIAHYSCFPGEINEYKYQSCEALRLYQPPSVPFSFDKAPDKSTFWGICGYVDSLPQQGLEPVITSCQRAGRTVDLLRANVITRRGAVLSLSMGTEDVYNVSFVGGKLHILRGTFELRREVRHNGPYYGYCFEELCARSTAEKPHGTFFSVVTRKIGELNVIMAGEVDCSLNMEPRLENYIELKTAKNADSQSPPSHNQIFVKSYLQSYLLGVPTLAIGYRNYREQVYSIRQKSTQQVLRDTQKYVPGFDPAISLGRAHAILSALLEYFRSLGRSVSAQDAFELRVNADGSAWVTSLASSSAFTG